MRTVGGLHLGSRASCWDGSLGAFVQSKGGHTCFKYARALTASFKFQVAFHQLHFSFPMIEAPVPLRDVLTNPCERGAAVCADSLPISAQRRSFHDPRLMALGRQIPYAPCSRAFARFCS